MDMLIYIAPFKMQKAGLKLMIKAGKRKNFPIVETLTGNVTHIVTSCETIDQFKRISENIDLISDKTVFLKCSWITDSLKQGKLIEVGDYLLENETEVDETTDFNEYIQPEWACQRSTPLDHNNKALTDALEFLEMHAQFTEPMGKDDVDTRALAFRKASAALKSLPFTVRDVTDIRGVKDIGSHCIRVIKDILESGYSMEVENKNDDWYRKMKLFTSIYGVGPSTAKKWIAQNFKAIDDVIMEYKGSNAKDHRLVYGLAFHNELNKPVKLNEAQEIELLVSKIASELYPGILITKTGGFRRGKTEGHDVDILISHPDFSCDERYLEKILQKLSSDGYILTGIHEGNRFKEEYYYTANHTARGQLDYFEKWIGIIKVPVDNEPPLKKIKKSTETDSNCLFNNVLSEALSDRNWIARRVDLILVPYDQFFYALVGWTGSKMFNRSLRHYAKKELNMFLTSHGLYDLEKRQHIKATSEEEVFKNLKLAYREPKERNC